MRINQITEGSRYKCTCHPGDADPDCPVHGLEPMEVGDALDVKPGVAEGSTGVSVRKWANQVRKDHGADVKFWNRKEGGGAVDSVIARNSQGETVGVYNRKTGYPTVYEPKQGVAEGDLNEKSTSQAQFRTMAAAAHNPKFAKKVGIKQSVAREFNKADTGQDYKSLPKRATEGATVTTTPGSIEPGGAVDNFKQQMANNTERDMAEGNRKPEPPEADYGPAYQDMVQRVKKLAGLGPLKTVYDPARRVYRNMPTAVQPKK